MIMYAVFYLLEPEPVEKKVEDSKMPVPRDSDEDEDIFDDDLGDYTS